MSESDQALAKIVQYMRAHWPSQVKPEWQVDLPTYRQILPQVLADFTAGKTKGHTLIRIAGLSGSGKTTQLLPAAEAYFADRGASPVLVAAREFVPYHPHYAEIQSFYAPQDLRKMTDEFATIMMFLALSALTREQYDIILDVTLLDPEMEAILVKMLNSANYQASLLMIAASPEVTERHLGSRSWRHTRETEQEFIRATGQALAFYATQVPDMATTIWNVYDLAPVYHGPAQGAPEIFAQYSAVTDIPPHDEQALRAAKIDFITSH